MSVTDIRPAKAELRSRYRAWRQGLTPEQKSVLDAAMTAKIQSLWQYRDCETLLTYVSTSIEVGTHSIIEHALSDGKRVAVPRCIPGTRNMEFYYICGWTDLEPGAFGVLEPKPQTCKKLEDLSEGLCLVPAFSYDWKGFRLGYGKGYYDRFLSRFAGDVVGICYSACVQRHLPHGRFDRPVELLVTEKYIRRTAERRAKR